MKNLCRNGCFKHQIFKKQTGITLIALVITIIVMLILVGVTLNMISGENGILGKAERAVNETVVAMAREETQLYVSEGVSEYYSKVYVEHDSTVAGKTVAKYIEDNTPADGYETPSGNKIMVNGDLVKCFDKNGKSLFTQIINDEGGLSDTKIPKGLKIGSAVSYSPSVTYNWQAKYCSLTKTETTDDVLLSSANGEDFSITSWKVFSINESSGEVQLVPSSPTSGTVNLSDTQSFNNGVKLLNDACSSLYGNETKGILARSINNEDIEGVLDYNPAEDSRVSEFYGKIIDIEDHGPYPIIGMYQKGAVFNGKTITEGWDSSEQSSFIEREEIDGNSAGLTSKDVSYYPFCNYYTLSFSEFSNKLRSIKDGEKGIASYADLLVPNGKNTMYWIATRVYELRHASGGDAKVFSIRSIHNGQLIANSMRPHWSSENAYDKGIFPLVTLNVDLINTDENGNFFINLEE